MKCRMRWSWRAGPSVFSRAVKRDEHHQEAADQHAHEKAAAIHDRRSRPVSGVSRTSSTGNRRRTIAMAAARPQGRPWCRPGLALRRGRCTARTGPGARERTSAKRTSTWRPRGNGSTPRLSTRTRRRPPRRPAAGRPASGGIPITTRIEESAVYILAPVRAAMYTANPRPSSGGCCGTDSGVIRSRSTLWFYAGFTSCAGR